MRRGDRGRGGRGEDEAWLDGDDHNNSNESSNTTTKRSMKEARRAVGHAAVQLVPFGAQAAASAAAYRSGLVCAQLVGLLLRVSSATPVFGPCLGALGVGLASALAGAAARHARKLCTEGGNPLDRGWWEAPRPADAALDGALGVVLHRALGGRLSAVMPSDLARPGARAADSLPASAGGAYAAPGAKRELARLFRRDGCHHCGTRKGPVVGDHMPPNVYVAGPAPGTAPNPGGYRGGGLLLEGEKMLARFRAALSSAAGGAGGGARGGRGGGGLANAAVPARLRQRFYAQCQRCSVRQAVAVRTGRRTLVLHLAPMGASRPERAVGLAVGLRQGAPPLAADSPVAIVAARVGGALSGAAESAAAAVREHRERRRREEAERRREEERRGGGKGGSGKGRGGGGGAGGGAAAAGGGGGWGGGGGNKGSSNNNTSSSVVVQADSRLSFGPSSGVVQRQEQAMLAWAVVGGPGGGGGVRQPPPPQQQQQQQQQQQASAFAAAAPVQGGLLAGPLYAEFVASAAANTCERAAGWGSAAGDAQQQQQQQRGAGGAVTAAHAAAAAATAPLPPPPRCYDAALAAYVSPGGAVRARPSRATAQQQQQQQQQQHYPPMPLPPQYLSSNNAAVPASLGVGAPRAAAAAPAAPAAAPAAAGDLSGVVGLASAAGVPSAEDAKRRAQEAFDRHFACPPAGALL